MYLGGRKEKGLEVTLAALVHNCTERSFAQSSMCVSKELKSMLSLQIRSESFPNPTPLYARYIIMQCMMYTSHRKRIAEHAENV